MNHKFLFFILLVITISPLVFSEDTILESNVNNFSKSVEVEQLKNAKKLNQSLFYPEINVVTGVGSEYSKGDEETEKGGILYLDARMNLYRGMEDYNSLKINEMKIQKATLEKELELNKVRIEYFSLISDNEVLIQDIKLIQAELENNKSQESMARKKVNAGLTTDAELLDFQIKQDNLLNEILANELKIKENENAIKSLFGNKFSLEEIKKQIQLNQFNELKKTQNAENLNLTQLAQDVSLSQLELDKSRSGYLPKIDLEAKAGSITPQTRMLKDKTEHQVALTLTIPLFSGFSSDASAQQLILDKQLKERTLKDYQLNLPSVLENEEKRIELSRHLIATNEKTLNKAEKFQRQTISEYKRGIKNSPDLISASDRVFELKRKANELNNDLKKAIFNYNTNYTK